MTLYHPMPGLQLPEGGKGNENLAQEATQTISQIREILRENYGEEVTKIHAVTSTSRNLDLLETLKMYPFISSN